MKYGRIHLGLLLVIVIFASAAFAKAEDKYTLKIATMELPPCGWINKDQERQGLVF